MSSKVSQPPKKTVRKPFRKNDANKLSVCSIKGTCPIADVYNCQFTYGGYDPLTMSAIGLYTGQYIWGANNIYDPIQSGGGNQPYYYDQLIAPTSGVTGLYKSWKVSGSKRLSLSSVLQAQTLSQSMSGCSQSLQTMRLSQPIPPTSTVSSLKAHHPHSRRWISDSAEDNKLSSYLRPRQHHLERLECQRLQYQGAYSSGPQKLTYWYIIAKPADGATTSQIFMNAKLTYYCELSERNQECDIS